MGKELKKHNTMPEFKKNRNPILMKGIKGSPIHANYGSPMEMDPEFKHKKKTKRTPATEVKRFFTDLHKGLQDIGKRHSKWKKKRQDKVANRRLEQENIKKGKAKGAARKGYKVPQENK